MICEQCKAEGKTVEVPSEEAPRVRCALCGGPHNFDTYLPNEAWYRVIRNKGLPEYLCTTCIVRKFVEAGESFTAELWSDGFDGERIQVIVGPRPQRRLSRRRT